MSKSFNPFLNKPTRNYTKEEDEAAEERFTIQTKAPYYEERIEAINGINSSITKFKNHNSATNSQADDDYLEYLKNMRNFFQLPSNPAGLEEEKRYRIYSGGAFKAQINEEIENLSKATSLHKKISEEKATIEEKSHFNYLIKHAKVMSLTNHSTSQNQKTIKALNSLKLDAAIAKVEWYKSQENPSNNSLVAAEQERLSAIKQFEQDNDFGNIIDYEIRNKIKSEYANAAKSINENQELKGVILNPELTGLYNENINKLTNKVEFLKHTTPSVTQDIVNAEIERFSYINDLKKRGYSVALEYEEAAKSIAKASEEVKQTVLANPDIDSNFAKAIYNASNNKSKMIANKMRRTFNRLVNIINPAQSNNATTGLNKAKHNNKGAQH